MTAVPNHVIIPPMNAIDPARFTHLHVHSCLLYTSDAADE